MTKLLERMDLLRLKETQLEQALDRVDFLEGEVAKYRAVCRKAVDRFREQMIELVEQNAKLRIGKVEAEIPEDDRGGGGDLGGPDSLADRAQEAQGDLGADDLGADQDPGS